MAWSDAEVRKYVLSSLGHPKRKVELDHSNINEALQRAIRFFSSKMPVYRFDFVDIISGKQDYDFKVLSKPYGKGLTRVFQEPVTKPSAAFSEFNAFYPYYWSSRGASCSRGYTYQYSDLVLERMYYDELAMTSGSDFDWEWFQDRALLLVKPEPNRSFRLGYEYNYTPKKITEIPDTYQGWVADYTLALAKQMLSMVRRKFQGVPGNDLPVETDGSDLMGEGKEEAEALKESLWNSRGDRTPPVIG